MKSLKTLLVIPARAGSKGLPGKHLLELNGKKLIEYAIQSAIGCSFYFQEKVISTDCEEMLNLALGLGMSAPFKRPKQLAEDETTSVEVLKHAVLNHENRFNHKLDFVMLLQATNPLVSSTDIDNVMEMLISIEDEVDGIISVTELKSHFFHSSYVLGEDTYLKKITEETNSLRRQDIKSRFFKSNGGIYVVRRDVLFKQNTIYTNKTYPYLMPIYKHVDIDDSDDFELAKKLIS